MQTRMIKRIGTTIAALALLTLISASNASAATLTFELKQNALTNVDDDAGRWQHDGGDVLYQGRVVGHYAITRRVTFGGTDQSNTAMLTMTMFFFLGGAPPQNITLQGAHDFSSGRYIGSVSAASSSLSVLINAQFDGSTASDTLTLTF